MGGGSKVGVMIGMTKSRFFTPLLVNAVQVGCIKKPRLSVGVDINISAVFVSRKIQVKQ
jgi:hypothetical protein